MELLLIYPPCFDNPWFTYIGARSYEKRFSAEWIAFKDRWKERITFLTYPCPELIYEGWPRFPNGRKHYGSMNVEPIVDFLLKVIQEEKPRRVIVVGKKYSPTCATFNTTDGEARVPEEVLRKWGEVGVGERRRLKRDIRGLKVVEGAGVFMEKLLKSLEGIELVLFELYPRSRSGIGELEEKLGQLYEGNI